MRSGATASSAAAYKASRVEQQGGSARAWETGQHGYCCGSVVRLVGAAGAAAVGESGSGGSAAGEVGGGARVSGRRRGGAGPRPATAGGGRGYGGWDPAGERTTGAGVQQRRAGTGRRRCTAYAGWRALRAGKQQQASEERAVVRARPGSLAAARERTVTSARVRGEREPQRFRPR
nr:paraneoplastic antigen Ma6E-like [Aegilops tauschii subsp. strangulata]